MKAKAKTFIHMDHQGKGRAYVDALLSRDYVEIGRHDQGPVALILSDNDVLGRRAQLEPHREKGSRIFLYPHAARPFLPWDGIFPPWEHTTAGFVSTETQIKITEQFGIKVPPLHAVGWSLCPLEPFKPTRGRKVLFAPIHPNSNSWLSDLDLKINRAVFDRLYGLVKLGEISLKVRYLHSLESNGLNEVDHVEFIPGNPDQTYSDIDSAELVVAHQTFHWMSVARGKPTLAMAEWEEPRCGNHPDNFRRVSNWSKYRDLMIYPLDILAEDDTLGLIRRASQSDELVSTWRSQLVGEAFSPDKFVDCVEAYL